MSNSSYLNTQIIGNTNPLVGFTNINSDNFSLINNKISSWSFDGNIPAVTVSDTLWNKELKTFNIAPGDYLIVDVNGIATTYPVVDITTDGVLGFFDSSDRPSGNRVSEIDSVSGNGTQITYGALNDYVANERVTITNMPNPAYNLTNVKILSATPTTFTVAGTETTPVLNYTDFSPTAEIVASFRSNVFINYLDNNYQRQIYQIVPILDDDGYPYNRIAFIRDNWTQRSLGSGGWLLTSSGNAIFNNIAARGEINATSGNFEGFLTVNNESMKLGAGVVSLKRFAVQSFSVSSNIVTITTTTNHTFNVGDTIKLIDTNSMDLTFTPPTPGQSIPGTAFELDGLHTVKSKTANTFTFDFIAPDTTTKNPLSSFVELNSYYDGIYITPENYWYSNGMFSVGGPNGITYDGTNIAIGSDVDINAVLTANSLVVGEGSALVRISNNVSDTNNLLIGPLVNDGIYINQYNYWYSTGRFSVGGANGTISFDPLELDTELRVTDRLVVGTNNFGNIEMFGGETGSSTYIKVGYGTFFTDNAKFYVDGTGRLSLGSKLKFDPQNILGPTLTVNGIINATSGNFINTVTIGQSATPGSLQVGTGINYFKIDGTNTNTTTAIYTNGASFNTAGVWLDASGRFSLGNKFSWNGSDLSITGGINATSGSFTGAVNIATGGSLTAGNSTDGIIINNTGLYGYDNGIAVFSIPTSAGSSPTLANFKVVDTAILSDGANANLIIGDFTNNNITIRGQYDSGSGILPAIFTTINGQATSAVANDGFYIDRDGRFKLQRTIIHTDIATGGNAGENTITFSSTVGINTGMLVSGSGIGSGAKVTSVNGTIVTLSVNNISSPIGNVITFTKVSILESQNGDLSITGTINAQSGNFEGALTVNNGNMKIGTGVYNDGTLVNDGIHINGYNYWYSDGKFKVGANENTIEWDPVPGGLSVSGNIFAKSGRIGGLSPTDELGWIIETGLIKSGIGDKFVALSNAGLGFSKDQQTLDYPIKKLVINNEGNGLSTLYLHVYVSGLESFLETELSMTINNQNDLDFAINQFFGNKPILFTPENIFSTTLNVNLETKLVNKWIGVQSVGNYAVSLINGNIEYDVVGTTDLLVLEFYGEDYAYNATDEIISDNILDTYHWTNEVIKVLTGSSGAGNYIFWTGSELAENASFSIDTAGAVVASDISSNTLVSNVVEATEFKLDNHKVTISTIAPLTPVDGDIWIEIV